jgi:cellulose biosynthesis protein BcsQ
MLTVAVLQQKGGSGKTTLAVNLAAAAHLEGRRTLVVDMDRQASAFDWSAARQDGSALEGLAVVKADKAIALPRFREITRGYDYVFLDGPPRLGDVTQSAAVAADVAVLPIQPGPFDFWAVAETLESLDHADQIREQLGRPPIRRVFVVNRAASNTRPRGRSGARQRRRRARERDPPARRVPRRCISRRVRSHVARRRSRGGRRPTPLAPVERWKEWVSA